MTALWNSPTGGVSESWVKTSDAQILFHEIGKHFGEMIVRFVIHAKNNKHEQVTCLNFAFLASGAHFKERDV